MNSDKLQNEVDTLLRKGVLYSIIWLMGVGSLISIIKAIKAKRIIDRSNNTIVGMGKVWWCFIFGGIGLLFWGFILVRVILNILSESWRL